MTNPPRTRRDRWTTIAAWAAVISNGLIAVTGATVRVTGSGLGCSTWPECHPGSLVPEYRTGLAAFHQAVEFGNRTITGLVLAASLGTFLLIVTARPRRKDLVALAAIGPIGVLVQALVGGVVVVTGLQWWTVAPHLLLSLGLVFAAVAVVVRLPQPDSPLVPVVPRPLRLLAWGTVAALTAVTVTGTLVTAAGPHAGDVTTPRLDISLRDIAQVHSDLMHLYLGLVIAMTVAFVAVGADRRLRSRAYVVIGLTAAQGIIGTAQFRLGVPEALVLVHVFGAVCLTAAAAFLALATRRPA